MRVTALALLATSITMVARAKDTIGDRYDLSQVMTVVALEWLSVEDYDVAEPLKAKFTEKKVVSKLCKAIAAQEAENYVPFLGRLDFCRIALLNQQDEVIAIVGIENDYRCGICPGRRDAEGRFVQVRNEGEYFSFTSDNLARALLARLRESDPAYVRRYEDAVLKSKKTAEEFLFGNKDGEQDGADQPATAPESKAEGNEKTKPESEVSPQ